MATDVKRQIAETFEKNARKVGMDKVTINMIVKECNISRQAFYYYYQDIIDVARFVMREGLQMNLDKGMEAENPEEAVRFFADDLVSRFPLISISMNSRLRVEMEKLLIDEFTSFFLVIFAGMECGRGMTRKEKAFHADMLACGVAAYSVEHCNDINFDEGDFSDQLWGFIRRSYGEE